ncbi:MAG TPA: hypothetical protein VJ739_09085 [Gemmataceae bacterium]|nr:hypothetical protein [Gemmataceae bacterium]
MRRLVAVLPAVGLLALTLAAPGAPEAKPAKPVNLDRLNTKDDEDDPFLSSSGLTLYYAAKVKDRWQLHMATRRRVSQPWPAGAEVDGYFVDKADNRGACLTPDGRYPQYLYFATNKDPEKDDERGDNYDIYVTVRQRAGVAFTSPTPVQGICTAEDETHPWLAGGGRQLYFSRKTKDGWRVYVATGSGAANFTNPKPVDLPAGYCHATLTPDGKTMYLQGPLEKDRWGIFRSHRTESGWGKPEALDALNSTEAPTGDLSPSLSRDGKLLYFASDRPGGKGGLDLWVVQTAQLKK